MAAALVLAQLRAQMVLPGYAAQPSLGLLYITDHFADEARELLQFMAQQLPGVQGWSGTVGIGVAANNAEYFDEPALSVMLCDIPPAQWRIFSGVAPLPRRGLADFDACTALVHADEFTPDLSEVLEEMAQRTSADYLFGGIAASRGPKVQFALDFSSSANPHISGPAAAQDHSGVLQGGLSGVAFGPQVQWLSRLSQGCQPIAPWAVVTAVQDNLVLELDGVPALDMLLEILGVTLAGDTQPLLDALGDTFAGLLEPGVAPSRTSGDLGPDARVRHILGLDTTRRGVAIEQPVPLGTQLAFCQRQPSAARADLMRICAEIREELEPAEDTLLAHGGGSGSAIHSAISDEEPSAYERTVPPRRMLGAVYVSCSDRSGEFFGGASAELQIVRRALGDVPLVGFFARGEIASHRLYGYTGVLTVFVGGAEPSS